MTRFEVAQHELAHSAAAAVAAQMMNITGAECVIEVFKRPAADGTLGTCRILHSDTANHKTLQDICVCGPTALLPEDEIARHIRLNQPHSRMLSQSDHDRLKDRKGAHAPVLPATWALLSLTGKHRLSAMALTLMKHVSVDLPLDHLWPRNRVKQAIARAPRIVENARLERALMRPTPLEMKAYADH